MSVTYKRNCDKCGNYYKGRGKKYCSFECFSGGTSPNKYWLGKKIPDDVKSKISKTVKENPTRYWSGKVRNDKTKLKISKKLSEMWEDDLYREYMSLIHKGQHSSPNTQFKDGNIPWSKGKENPHAKGEKNFFWKGGVTEKNHGIRIAMALSGEYKRLRLEIFKRDNYKCQICKSGKNICMDHIKSFINYPELRMEKSNLRTLCNECHKKTDNYGYSVYNKRENGELV